MNKPLTEITCKDCNTIQNWRGQSHCANCGKHLSNWSVAAQLKLKNATN